MRKILRNALALSAFSALTAQAQVLVEYANRGDFPAAPYSNFFYTADPGEQAALDAGSFGAFYRTGATLNTGGSSPVCRFYGSVSPGPNSHFYTANAAECNALKAQQRTPRPATTQQWNYEGDGFRVTPFGSACPTGTKPVYRAYNGAFSPTGAKQAWDSNHRLTTRPAEIELLKQLGWRDEGIAFCVAASPVDPSPPSAPSLQNYCRVVRADPSWGDKPGSLAQEKKWVRSFVDERYLWYGDTPRSPEAWYASGADYMDAQLSPYKTANGSYLDRYSFTMTTDEFLARFVDGVAFASFGMDLILLSTAPVSVGVRYTEPGSPAALASIQRGDVFVSVDGVPLSSVTSNAQLGNMFFPANAGVTRRFVVRSVSGAQRTVSMTSANVAVKYVNTVKTLPTASGNVGYILFNGFTTPAEGELIAAFNQLKASAVNDLVLDLRYNGGGLLDLAAQLGYMVAGAQSIGKVFEKVTFNDKRVADNNNPNTVTPFITVATGDVGSGTTAGAALPTLNLNRLYVIATEETASASEAIINSLRGIGLQVVIVGDTTYGKPYGFYPEENCGTVYLLTEFKGANALGFGDYAEGFAPTCRVADDLSHALGDAAEASIAAALAHRRDSRCPAGTQVSEVKRSALDRVQKFGNGNRPAGIRRGDLSELSIKRAVAVGF